MATLAKSQQRRKPKGLDEERAEWLLAFLKLRCEALYLNGPTYRDMRRCSGFSKSDLDRSLALLKNRGLVRIERNLMVELIEESETCLAG